MDLTKRHREILKTLVEHYVEVATPVSSGYLANLGTVGLSSASIRSVLHDLETQGYLQQPHTSAGRIPTAEGFRYYVTHLLDRHELSQGERHSVREKILGAGPLWRNVMNVVSHQLASLSHYAGLVFLQRFGEDFYIAGRDHFLDVPEFADTGQMRAVLQALEERHWLATLFKKPIDEGRIQVFIGGEKGMGALEHCSVVATSYRTRERNTGSLGIMGPRRMRYDQIIPLVEYTARIVEDLV